jgi:hypothetical protein
VKLTPSYGPTVRSFPDCMRGIARGTFYLCCCALTKWMKTCGQKRLQCGGVEAGAIVGWSEEGSLMAGSRQHVASELLGREATGSISFRRGDVPINFLHQISALSPTGGVLPPSLQEYRWRGDGPVSFLHQISVL